MGFPSENLPEAFRRRMPTEERRKMGALTTEEFTERYHAARERDLHDVFERWLRIKGLPFLHSRMDKPSTIAKGWPDFTVTYGGRVYFVEFKSAEGTLRPDQEQVIAALRAVGNTVLVSTDAGHAIQQCAEFFKV